MFSNTRAAFDKILCDIKNFCFSIGIILNTVYIFSMVYAIVDGRGFLPLNIAFLVAAVAYFVYYIVTYWNKSKKSEKKRVKNVYNAIKFFASTVTLAITVYSIYVGSEQINFISLLLAVISVLSWVFHVISRLIIMFLESRKELIINAFNMDMQPVAAPVNAVNSFVKRISGQDEPEELFHVSEKAKSKINKIRSHFFDKKNKEKEEKRKKAEEKKEKAYK